MGKRSKIVKRLMSLIFVLILCINMFGYAAIVSDNDGSAFVTKSEFEAMKKSFSEQINNYENSITEKIDGAIASYLAGINIAQPSTSLFEKYIKTAGSKPLWMKTYDTGAGTSGFTTDVTLKSTLHETIYRCTENVAFGLYQYSKWNSSTAKPGDTRGIFSIYFGTAPTDNYANFGGNINMGHTDTCLWDSTFPVYHWGAALTTLTGNPTWSNPYYANYSTVKNTHVSTGAGSGWITQKVGSRTFLKQYCTTCYLQQQVESWFHGYADCRTAVAYRSDGGKGYTNNYNNMDCNLNNTGSGETSKGTKYTDNNTNVGRYASISSSINKVNDSIDYLNVLWSIKSDDSLTTLDEDYKGALDTSGVTLTVDDGEWYDVYYSGASVAKQTNTQKGGSFTYNKYKLVPTMKNFSTLCSYAASSLAGENVYNGGGLPIIETLKDEKEDKIKIKLTSTHNNTCHVKISDKQFVLGSLATGATSLYDGDITANADATTINFTTPKKGFVWLWLENTSNDETVTIDNIQVGG